MTLGYEINLEHLCKNQVFSPAQVVSSELVFPRGAVPNSQILWVRVELTSNERKFITLPLRDFYEYISLPESSIGGWTEGHKGGEGSGLNARYMAVNAEQPNVNRGSDYPRPDAGDEVDNPSGSEALSGELLDGAEGSENTVET